MIKQKVTYTIYENDHYIATLIIGAENGYKYDTNVLQQDHYTVELENIPVVTYPDALTPLQYLDPSSDLSIAPLMLLEETDYQVQLEIEKNIPEDNINPPFQELHERGNDKALQLNKWFIDENESKHIYRGTLRFSSYVGKSFFDITIAPYHTPPIPFEVRSKKIGYLEQYPVMLSELAEFTTSLLLNKTSPVHEVYRFSDSPRNIAYEDFIFLEYLFLDEHLPEAYDYIRRNVHSTLKRYIEQSLLEHSETLDPAFLPDIFSSSNLCKSESVTLACLPPELRGYVPLTTYQINDEETVDTPENRLVKETLLSIEHIIETLLSSSVNSGYIEDKLLLFKETISEYLADDWLKDVSALTYIPMNSQFLHKKEGYRDIFHYFLCLDLAFSLESDELEDILKGNNRKLYEVYEFWCYIKLISALTTICTSNFNGDLDILYDKKDNEWVLDIKREEKSKLQFTYFYNGKKYDIFLYYNKTYRNTTNLARSYSLEFRPDYSLCIETEEGSRYFIHFDAKYRARYEITESLDEEAIQQSIEYVYWRTDIEKMHTYKDALSHTLGAFILYPGTSDKYYLEKGDATLPSVGAIGLTPGNKSDEYTLESFIKERLDFIIHKDMM
jgi:hypothetical protein